MTDIQRSIYFYEVKFLKDNQNVNPNRVYDFIERLTKSPEDKYWEIEKDKYLFVTSKFIDNKIRGFIAMSRNKDFPYEEIKLDIHTLNLSSSEAKLCELAHFVIFEDNIMGMEYNQRGPRAGAMINYLHNKASEIVDKIEFNNLTNLDIGFRIEQLRDINSIFLKIDTEEGMKCSSFGPEVMNLLTNLTAEFNGRELFLGIKGAAPGLIIPGIDSMKKKKPVDLKEFERIKSVKIEAKNEQNDKLNWYNILDDILVYKVKAIKNKDNSRNVDTEDMFAKIEEAYNNNYEVIHFVDNQIRKIYQQT